MMLHANHRPTPITVQGESPASPPGVRIEGLEALGQLGQLGQLSRIAGGAQLSQTQEKALEDAIESAVREALAAAAAAQRANSPEAAEAAREQAQAAVADLRAQLAEMRAGARPGVAQVVPFPPDTIPPQAVDMAIAFFVMIAFVVVGLPLARAFARRMDRRSAPAPADLGPRLDRIEQAVEAVAIEVERISENQRYATKVMTELRGIPASQQEVWPGKAAREAEPVPRSGESR